MFFSQIITNIYKQLVDESLEAFRLFQIVNNRGHFKILAGYSPGHKVRYISVRSTETVFTWHKTTQLTVKRLRSLFGTLFAKKKVDENF